MGQEFIFGTFFDFEIVRGPDFRINCAVIQKNCKEYRKTNKHVISADVDPHSLQIWWIVGLFIRAKSH